MKDMTTGPVRGHIISMMMFMLVGLVAQTLYSLVDIYWVSWLGKEAVAAVAIGSNLMFVALAIWQMLGVGAVALVSQAAGRKEPAEVQRLFNQAQSLSVMVGIIFFIIGGALRHRYAVGMGSDAATVALIDQFLIWFIASQSLGFLMTGLASSLRGIGDLKPGLISQVSSVLLNIILAPFLIFGWGTGHPLGVAGAGMATFISTLAAVAGLIWYLMRANTYLRVDFNQWTPDWATWKRILGIGLPAGSEFIVMSIVLGMIYAVIKPFGAQAQAGLGIGMRVMQAGFMPAVAVSFAVAAVVGQNFGARQYERVRETFVESAKLVVGLMVVFTLLCQIAPGVLVQIFSSEAAVDEVGVSYLRTISLIYVGNGLIICASGAFQGMGNTLPALGASASRLLTFIIPVLWLSHQPGFTLQQVWNTSLISVTLQMLLSLWLLRRQFKLKLPVPLAEPVMNLV